ncbi:hypothetical protein D3C72_612700 [compost metagenome]
MGEVVAVSHGFAVPLRGCAQCCVPAQRPGGGEALASAHPWPGARGVYLSEQGLADAAVIADTAVEHRLRQHHLPFITRTTDTDVGVARIQQRGAVFVLQQVEGLFGVLGPNHANTAHRDGGIPGRLQRFTHATGVAITDRQGQVRLQHQRRQTLRRAPIAALRMGTIVVDGSHQLSLRTGMGGFSEQR